MADDRVQAAVANWAPRFVSQGVDINDFGRVTSRVETWPEWLPAWVENGDAHAQIARAAEEQGRTLTAGKAWNHAALSYHFAKFVWMVDLNLYRQAADKAVAALAHVHRLLDPRAERIEIPFEKTTMVGSLRRPAGLERTRAPLVLLLPGLDSTKEEFFSWENVFLQRGMATLSLEGPGQGETGYTTSIRPDYEVAVCAALDHVGWEGPVGLAGVSLGGYYAPRAAAFEPRVQAVAGVSGPFNFGEAWDARPTLTKETFQHHAGAASPEAAREKASELSLEGVAERIEQPLLVLTGKLDRLVLWRESKKIADSAPNSTWVLFDEGNHVCNNIPYKSRPLVADWLKQQLAA
ncbi:MAG: alpha/beta hydrolase family protein [Gaiellaceae bacterium]